ncbi:cyclomaltodextrin glucanotransferase [Pseudoxanthomonas broegbernensis]|uniref:Cyclomaltodextrin glucanotransferase n=1 Tax=Pseudoxanthomonas broegbernensis TaxID=83619 RepID=A0A7V8GQ82_9GAMM|nr:alpha-amylase family glycosyl hydrolase [Pseudoxanthomonas broegbernensis]KAF1688178.1 cyclomaltodextrin glucanotransferase [Pseudoxanthomonas broegbernensis]MBB6065231.1 glycosidase [Pseudoxanthomonas broegbernensis]
MIRGLAIAAGLALAGGAFTAMAAAGEDYYGTLEPFAAEAVYFVLTDRFVNGDTANDHRGQGGPHRTFDIPLPPCDGQVGNIGYLGGDFRGLLDNAGYIRDLGFTAVWITPIVDNPDQAFTGGDPVTCDGFLTDRGKTGYHGYWGVNFHRLDEHLPSAGLDFAGLTAGLRAHGLKTVLDIVANHGSPAWTMPVAQPQYGQLFDAQGELVADHQNLPPEKLDPASEPLHAFYNARPDLAQLGDLNADNPAVMDYLASAYLHWIGQGVDALRIDTIRHQPLPFWKAFADRIRAEHPGMYMFGEAFDYDAAGIAPFTLPENGGISVLDFPMKQAMDEAFGRKRAGFERLLPALHLQGGPYANPYDLATFYDNHDMRRLDADDAGFIDAHNWLFTARGIPVVYYGSETGFMRGQAEHGGNRAYFGQERIDAAHKSPIFQSLQRIATLRRASPALQRGLQLNLRLSGDTAAFYRVYQHGDTAQTALVLLNKGDRARTMSVAGHLQPGAWRDGFSGEALQVGRRLRVEVPAHGVRVFFFDAPLTRADLRARLAESMPAH